MNTDKCLTWALYIWWKFTFIFSLRTVVLKPTQHFCENACNMRKTKRNFHWFAIVFDCQWSFASLLLFFNEWVFKILINIVNRESRYILLLTENYGALNLLHQLMGNEENTHVIFGSSFPRDQEYIEVYNICLSSSSFSFSIHIYMFLFFLLGLLLTNYRKLSGLSIS